MSDTLTRPVDTTASAPPNPDVIVTVPAFAGIVVSPMQTLVIPIVPELQSSSHPDVARGTAADARTVCESTMPAVGSGSRPASLGATDPRHSRTGARDNHTTGG